MTRPLYVKTAEVCSKGHPIWRGYGGVGERECPTCAAAHLRALERIFVWDKEESA